MCVGGGVKRLLKFYFMLKSKKVSDLLGKVQKINKEIEVLQKKCTHPTKSLKSIKENVDSSLFICRWICSECNSVIGIPNQDELTNYLKQ